MPFVSDPNNIRCAIDSDSGYRLEKIFRDVPVNACNYRMHVGEIRYDMKGIARWESPYGPFRVSFAEHQIRNCYAAARILYGSDLICSEQEFYEVILPAFREAIPEVEDRDGRLRRKRGLQIEVIGLS